MSPRERYVMAVAQLRAEGFKVDERSQQSHGGTLHTASVWPAGELVPAVEHDLLAACIRAGADYRRMISADGKLLVSIVVQWTEPPACTHCAAEVTP